MAFIIFRPHPPRSRQRAVSGVGSSRGSVLEIACSDPRYSHRLSAGLPSHPLRGLRAQPTSIRWLLAISYWLLALSYWLLALGY